jgi:uncharacterized protein (DUF2164 family)
VQCSQIDYGCGQLLQEQCLVHCLLHICETQELLFGYGKWDALIDFFRDRYGWTWLNQDLGAWRKVHPQLTKEIEDIKSRLDKLENKK